MTHALSVAATQAVADVTPISVLVPAYDSGALTPSVVHLGVGGFHRAHQAVYFDDLAARGVRDWGIVGVGISRASMRDVLLDQGNLFTVIERGTELSTARVIGVIVQFLLLSEDPDAVRARLIDPQTRLVTLTITGDGYKVDGEEKTTVFSLLVDALEERHRRGTAPFTVLSCDNLPDAGAASRRATVTIARARSAELADWIERNVTFPSSMVDRITPSTSPEQRLSIEAEFGVVDRWPVITEPFRQWVVEDAFCNGRPPLDQVGVRFVDDVAPYKLIKSRLLNGSHCALGYLGYLAGHRTTDKAMADEAIAEYIEALMRDEIAPLLPADVPGMELEEYRQTLLERFRNPAIGDQLSRLCRRGSTKMGDYLLPSAKEAVGEDRPYELLALAVASWLRYVRGVDLDGEPIDVQDARADELRRLAEQDGTDPRPLLGLTDVFGELGADEAFVAEVERSLELLDEQGVHAAIEAALGGPAGSVVTPAAKAS
jgi:mannitol-1-phosphate/altronate dehydrogenase